MSSPAEQVESLVSLEYPNGRTHDAAIFGRAELQPGQEFDLHGRRWRALESRSRRTPLPGQTRRLRCIDVPPAATG